MWDVRRNCGLQQKTLESQAIIIDEGAQATEPATLFPCGFMSKTKALSRLVIIGDHQPLPPTVISPIAKWRGLCTSLFERLVRAPGMEPGLLTMQYRVHPGISRWPGHYCYEDRIETIDRRTDNRSWRDSHGEKVAEWHSCTSKGQKNDNLAVVTSTSTSKQSWLSCYAVFLSPKMCCRPM